MLANSLYVVKRALIGGVVAFGVASLTIVLLTSLLSVFSSGIGAIISGVLSGLLLLIIGIDYVLFFVIPFGIVIGACRASLRLLQQVEGTVAERVQRQFAELAIILFVLTVLAWLPTVFLALPSETVVAAQVVDISHDEQLRSQSGFCGSSLVTLRLDGFDRIERVCSSALANQLESQRSQSIDLHYEVRRPFGQVQSAVLTHVGQYRVGDWEAKTLPIGCIYGSIFAQCNSPDLRQALPF